MRNRNIVKIIEQYSENHSINLLKLSADWVLKLTKEYDIHYIIGYQFDLNSGSTSILCTDKSATSEVLNTFNIPNVEHTLFLPPQIDSSVFEKINNYLTKHEKIVCKTNTGTGGKDVYLIDNIKDLENVANKIFQKGQNIALCPFYNIKNEYRAIILNNEVKLLYLKERQHIIGDGISSISELISKQNISLKKLDIKNIDLNKILTVNEKYYLNWKHNLGLGASSKIISKDLDIYTNLSSLALSASSAVNGKFVSVDMIDTDDGLKILEINSGIMMENFSSESPEKYKIAEKIYGEAIELMFSQKRSENK